MWQYPIFKRSSQQNFVSNVTFLTNGLYSQVVDSEMCKQFSYAALAFALCINNTDIGVIRLYMTT